jgi:ribosome-associated translation inhibitor RaiA
MNIELRFRGLNATAKLRRWLEQRLEQLHGLIPVSSAAMLLERQRDAAPAFHAFVHLAVPGPDIHAEAREHTLEAVWLKVAAALRKQIEQRETRRKAREKSKLQISTGRWGRSVRRRG